MGRGKTEGRDWSSVNSEGRDWASVCRMAFNARVTESAPIHTSMLTVKTKTNNKLFLNANDTRCPGDLCLNEKKKKLYLKYSYKIMQGFLFLHITCP